MFERFDGLSKQGPWHDYFWNRYNDASDHLNRLREQVFPKIMEYRETKVDRSKKFYIESIDRTLTKDDIISIALNSGNESNLAKQMRGGIQFEKDQAATPLNEASLHEILSHLTPDEIKMVNGIWKTIETLKPEAAALERKRSGIEPKWIEPKPLEIANGTLEGGYYPLKYDPRFSAAGEKQSDASTVQQMFAKYASSSTKQGYLKGRTEFAAPLTLDWQATVSRHSRRSSDGHLALGVRIRRATAAQESRREVVDHAQPRKRLLQEPLGLGSLHGESGFDGARGVGQHRQVPAHNAEQRLYRGARIPSDERRRRNRHHPAAGDSARSCGVSIQGDDDVHAEPDRGARFATEASDYVKRFDKEVDRDITNALNDLAGKKYPFG
jgi:hypothetical protein